MSGDEDGIGLGSEISVAAILENEAAEAAALLADGRRLIEQARRILSEAYRVGEKAPTIPVLYQLLDERRLDHGLQAESASDGETAKVWGRRLLAAVPAAAGIALLGAGLAAVAGGSSQHALTVASPRFNQGPPSTFRAPQVSVATPPVIGAASTEAPLSLSVPRLHTDAVVAGEVYVQTSGPETGLLNAPADFHQLGWYRHGDSGALVLDGHVGYRASPGPLAFIGSLAAGDVVTVGFPSGERAFTVTVVGRAVKGQLPQQYFSNQYDADLMLITCDYTSPFRAGHFQDNVYLVAVPSQ